MGLVPCLLLLSRSVPHSYSCRSRILIQMIWRTETGGACLSNRPYSKLTCSDKERVHLISAVFFFVLVGGSRSGLGTISKAVRGGRRKETAQRHVSLKVCSSRNVMAISSAWRPLSGSPCCFPSADSPPERGRCSSEGSL